MAVEVEEKPLPSWGKAALTLNVLLALSCWLMVAYFYPRLPDVVPTHFDWEGNPTSWGPKSTIAFTIMPAVITVVVAFASLTALLRYKIVKRFPYLISIPALSLALGSPKVPPDVRGSAINRMIAFVLAEVALLAAWMVFFNIGMLQSTLEGRFIHGPALLASILALVIVLIASSIIYYRRLYLEVRQYFT
jgi:uncharacterized membrane protein